MPTIRATLCTLTLSALTGIITPPAALACQDDCDSTHDGAGLGVSLGVNVLDPCGDLLNLKLTLDAERHRYDTDRADADAARTAVTQAEAADKAARAERDKGGPDNTAATAAALVTARLSLGDTLKKCEKDRHRILELEAKLGAGYCPHQTSTPPPPPVVVPPVVVNPSAPPTAGSPPASPTVPPPPPVTAPPFLGGSGDVGTVPTGPVDTGDGSLATR